MTDHHPRTGAGLNAAPRRDSSPELRDSRRLTGPNLLLRGPGAVIDVAVPESTAKAAEAAWREWVGRMLSAVGWSGSRRATRRFPGGMSLAFEAPIDALYAATEVNERAWSAAVARLGSAENSTGSPSGPLEPLESAASRLRRLIEEESSPALLAMRAAARGRDVTFLSDDDRCSVGLGRGSRCWPTDAISAPDEVEWEAVHDVPVALVTGTNGKTTTIRLLAAMARAAGLVPGYTSTDGIQVGGELIEAGDWSGPGGARTVLRDRRVQVGLLETARGGILRRGVAVPRADAALITNVADDHLGEFGVHDIDALAEVKLVVGRVVKPSGRIVLNADDEAVVRNAIRAREAGRLRAPLTWVSLDSGTEVAASGVADGGDVCVLEGDVLSLRRGAGAALEVPVADVPMARGGAARHNIFNALAAMGVAAALDLPTAAIAEALRCFQGSVADNPGRGNMYELDGLRIVLDFAHNPHGMAALAAMVTAVPARRRLVVLGQAGDRDDDAIRALVREAWKARPDRVIIKELAEYRRGRQEGEVPDLIEDELLRIGAPETMIERADSEMDAIHKALGWGRAGDLILLIVHSHRDRAMELLDSLRAGGWSPGQPLD